MLWFLVSVSKLKGTFFLDTYGFFPMTACWVISKSLFYRFWFLHSTVFITEFHPVCNLQSMLNYCISNRKEGTCREQAVLDMLNLELNTPHSHFSCLKSAIFPSQSRQPWPTIKLPVISPRELHLSFHIMSSDSLHLQCINKPLTHTFPLKVP